MMKSAALPITLLKSPEAAKNLVSVDKANVLESTELWRDVVTEVGKIIRM